MCMREKNVRIQIVSEPSDSHSGAVGGGNAPISCMPNSVKQEKEEDTLGDLVGDGEKGPVILNMAWRVCLQRWTLGGLLSHTSQGKTKG